MNNFLIWGLTPLASESVLECSWFQTSQAEGSSRWGWGVASVSNGEPSSDFRVDIAKA